MLTLSYLTKILFRTETDGNGEEVKIPEIDGLDNPEWLMECRAGMGGAIQLIQNKNLPVCLVLEHPERHSLSLRNMGGFHECTMSVWIMEMVANEENPEDVMEKCYNRFKRLYSVLVNHIGDHQLEGWIENNELSAYDREAGTYVGYEVFINFHEYEDLSYV